MEQETPLQRDIMVFIGRDQRSSESGTAQVSMQILAETLEPRHGHMSIMQVRTTLSDLIDKGLVHFQAQIGGFQIVQCRLTDRAVALLESQGADMSVEPEPVPVPAGSEGLLEGIQRQINHVGDAGIQETLLAMAEADWAEDARDEVLSAVELLVEQAAAAPGPRRQGRARLALRSLQDLGAPGLESIVPWALEL